MLSVTLKNLERDGLVIRELFPEVPPRVEYEITDLGKSLLRPTQGLVDWAKANWERVRKAQASTIPNDFHKLYCCDGQITYEKWDEQVLDRRDYSHEEAIAAPHRGSSTQACQG